MTRTQEIESAQEVTLVAGAGKAQAGEGDLRAMLTAALDGIIELAGAARGMILLFNPEGELLIEKARTRGRRDLAPAELEVRRTVIEEVRTQGIRFLGEYAQAHPLLPVRRSGPRPQRLLVACVPIHDQGRACGLVYLDNGGTKAVFPDGSLLLAEWLAQLIAVAASRNSERTWRWRSIDATKWSCD
ncbi:MAG: GAF domain-containing protein [bacterium]|nr:GAF domain-containing protein [bacterium]